MKKMGCIGQLDEFSTPLFRSSVQHESWNTYDRLIFVRKQGRSPKTNIVIHKNKLLLQLTGLNKHMGIVSA